MHKSWMINYYKQMGWIYSQHKICKCEGKFFNGDLIKLYGIKGDTQVHSSPLLFHSDDAHFYVLFNGII